QIPMNLKAQHMDDIVCEKLHLDTPQADMTKWQSLLDKVENLSGEIKIALVGKYTSLPDAYISVNEALKHAGYKIGKNVKIDYFDAENLDKDNVADKFASYDGIIVPGGFGDSGLEGMIQSIRCGGEYSMPFLVMYVGM